ncbi:MAG: DegT/DnrJ/EryC1/StrS family aminotransferase [Anaerolineaceae bacterium]
MNISAAPGHSNISHSVTCLFVKINKMSYIQRIGSLFSPRAIFFIQPYWNQEQWAVALNPFNRSRFCDSPRHLEKEIMELGGGNYARSFNLGRTAIQIVLESFHFPAESEVILPSFSCPGVMTPVMYAGLIPVLVDIDQDFNMLASSMIEAITPQTRAVILPHLSGKLANDFFNILEIAERNNLKVIMDATQALGLTVSGKWIGLFGDAGVYSFNGGKLIPSSGGGLLVTNDDGIISYCQSREFPKPDDREGIARISDYIFEHGLQKITSPFRTLMKTSGALFRSRFLANRIRIKNHKYKIEDMDVIEAELARSQLKHIPIIIEKRKQNAAQLIESNVLQSLGFHIPDPKDNIFTKFLVSHEDPDFSLKIRKILLNHGIEVETSYTPLPLKNICPTARVISTPNTDRLWKSAFSIPINPRLGPKNIDRIIQTLKFKV